MGPLKFRKGFSETVSYSLQQEGNLKFCLNKGKKAKCHVSANTDSYLRNLVFRLRILETESSNENYLENHQEIASQDFVSIYRGDLWLNKSERNPRLPSLIAALWN